MLTTLLLAACGGAPEGGQLTGSVFGVVMPQGSYLMAEEEIVGNEGAAASYRFLVTPKSVAELGFSFSQGAQSSDRERHRHTFEGGVSVTLAPLAEIPRTHLAPVRPVVSEAPSSMESWIVVSRQGQPAPCPPCPEGFTGTLAPGCHCGE